jgi:3-oxoadipate CoA-transferase, alpha subunit
MVDKRVSSVEEALGGICDDATIMIAGFGRSGWPRGLMAGLAGLKVRNLTLVANAVISRYEEMGQLFQSGIIGKVITSAARSAEGKSFFEQQWRAGRVELECVPQGTFVERIRAGGAGIPAFYSHVGVGTELTRDKESRCFGGVEHVLETAITADYALIRGDVGDRYGNISFRFTQVNFALTMAAAARCTIAQVNRAADSGLPPDLIRLPGVYVQRLISLGV